VHERVLEFIENSGGKYILDRKLIEKIYNSDPDEIDAALVEFERQLSEMKKRPKNQHVYVIAEFDLAEQFMQDIQSDLELLREIQSRIGELDLVANDPKAEKLVAEIDKILHAPPQKENPGARSSSSANIRIRSTTWKPILEKKFNGKVVSSNAGLSANQLKQYPGEFRRQHQGKAAGR
jgi:hypothetical protein